MGALTSTAAQNLKTPHSISFSDGTEHLYEEGLGCEHLGAPLECSRATAGANPVGRRPRLAIGGCHRDVATKADDEVELQVLAQHPIELVLAEAAIGHDAHTDIGGQNFGQTHQDLLLVAVATVSFRASYLRSARPEAWPVRGGTTATA
jgi:hypothetical protein